MRRLVLVLGGDAALKLDNTAHRNVCGFLALEHIVHMTIQGVLKKLAKLKMGGGVIFLEELVFRNISKFIN